MKLAIFFSLLIAFGSPSVAEPALGVASINVPDDGQSRPLALSLWYLGIGAKQQNVGGNAVFRAIAAAPDAQPVKARLPVVLVSHGGLRSVADSGAWLSAALARVGYLAVEISAARPATAAKAVDEIWRRPNDVSRALDAILSDATWSKRIDQSRISVVGFALGGTAALALGRGQFESQTFVQSCDKTPSGPDCAWYQAQHVALESVDRDELAKSRHDSRIDSIVAVAPEYFNVLSRGLSSADVPTRLVFVGIDKEPHIVTQTKLLTRTVLTNVSKFDGFQVCTPAGPSILAEDGGDAALCGASAQARQRAHDAIVSEIVTFLSASH